MKMGLYVLPPALPVTSRNSAFCQLAVLSQLCAVLQFLPFSISTWAHLSGSCHHAGHYLIKIPLKSLFIFFLLSVTNGGSLGWSLRNAGLFLTVSFLLEYFLPHD